MIINHHQSNLFFDRITEEKPQHGWNWGCFKEQIIIETAGLAEHAQWQQQLTPHLGKASYLARHMGLGGGARATGKNPLCVFARTLLGLIPGFHSANSGPASGRAQAGVTEGSPTLLPGEHLCGAHGHCGEDLPICSGVGLFWSHSQRSPKAEGSTGQGF